MNTSTALAGTRLPNLRQALGLAAFAAAYALLTEVSVRWFALDAHVAVVWFPAGLALVAVLLGGMRYGVAVWVADLLALLLRGEPWGVAMGVAVGNAAAAVLSTWVLQRQAGFRAALPTMRDYAWIAAVGGAGGSAVSALAGVSALVLAGQLPQDAYLQTLLHWFAGNAVGVLLLAPCLLIWHEKPPGWGDVARLREAALLALLGFLVGQMVFAGWLNDPQGLLAQPYWLFAVVAAATPRVWRHGVALGLLMFSVQGALAVADAAGMFTQHDAEQRQGHYWVFISALAVFGMAGASYFERLIRTQRALALQEASYRSQFADNSAVFVMFELDGQLVDANQAALDFYGYSREELLKLSLYQISLRTAAEVRDTLQTVGRADGPGRFESQQRLADGSVRDVVVSVSLVRVAGRPVMHSIVFDVTEQKRAEAEIENLAFFDPLTHLPNRRLLLDRLGLALSGAVRSGRKGALLFIDLDNFKTLNDAHGHEKGDLLLQQTAERLRSCVRFGDTVARLGGDEFVVMLMDLSEAQAAAAGQVKAVAAKVLAALNEPYRLDGIEHHGSGSLGVALFGDPGDNIDELFKRADLALYEAKGMGRNAMRFFDPAMQDAMVAKAQMGAELRRALEAGQFILHYQIQVDEAYRVIGLESLVRWRHPEQGLVLPGKFIAVAEETGLILPLGQEVLRMACAQLAAWAAHPVLSRLSLSVNVSARQFRQPDYVQTVADMLQRTGAPADRLKLELTESLLVADVDDVIAKMRQLRDMGLQFSLDDFGTGYSSLVYLKRMPLEQLKIDQAFVRDLLSDPNDAAIASAVIQLGHSLGLSVVAEGVETQAQRDHLFGQGCRVFQGYLFGTPIPAEELERQLATSAVASTY